MRCVLVSGNCFFSARFPLRTKSNGLDGNCNDSDVMLFPFPLSTSCSSAASTFAKCLRLSASDAQLTDGCKPMPHAAVARHATTRLCLNHCRVDELREKRGRGGGEGLVKGGGLICEEGCGRVEGGG